MDRTPKFSLQITLPAWVAGLAAAAAGARDDQAKMALALALARENVRQASGGPFGAAIFNRDSGALLSVGVNMVVPTHNSVLHAEMTAIMLAESIIASHTLMGTGRYELFTSCAPCAMCLGGILWSGVERLVCAAEAEDARRIGFDEGPVSAESYRYLHKRGIEVVRGFMRREAKAVLDDYATHGGQIYNRR